MFKSAGRQTNLTVIFALTLLLTMAGTTSAYAYTVVSQRWASLPVGYKHDASIGFNWLKVSLGAFGDWNAIRSNFVSSSSTSNIVSADPSISGCNCLAQTQRWFDLFNTQITRFKTTINTGSGYAFYDGTQAPSIPPNYHDLRTLFRHEYGHALGLCHTAASGQLMTLGLPPGRIFFIDQDALNGRDFMYKAGYTGPGPSGGCIL